MGTILGFLLAVVMAQVERTQTLSELETIDVTVPIVRVVGSGETASGHTPYLDVWVSDDGQSWREVFNSGAYYQRHMSDPGPRQQHEYLFLLDSFPRYVRVGTTGYYSGVTWIDGLTILAPDGTEYHPASLRAVNNVLMLEEAEVIDDQGAWVFHWVGTDEETWRVDAVEFTFDYPPGIDEQVVPLLNKVPLDPLRMGVYTTPGGDNDAHHVPPGYTYWADAEAIAKYDFSILQGNVPELTRQIKQINPNHRIILRGYIGGPVVLDYVYDPVERGRIVKAMLDLIAPTPELIHAVTINEEEVMNMFWGWYWSEPPAWLTKYRDRYEQETGNEFVFQSEPLRLWLAEKGRFLYNDLYDRIKVIYPQVKVLPFMALPGDLSGWAWIDPSEIKADGWVYQWFGDNIQDGIMPCRHILPEITEVSIRDRWFNMAIQHLRTAGVPWDEVYVQIWAFQSTDDYRPQLAGVRDSGVANVFCFYYCGWVPPEPPDIRNLCDLAFAVRGPEGEWPDARHEAHPVFLEVGEGRAQSFVAAENRIEGGRLYLKRPQSMPVPGLHTVTLQGDGRAIPNGTILASAAVDPAVLIAEEWVNITLAADVEAGKTYWVTLRPDDGNWSKLGVGASQDDSFTRGQSVFFEYLGGYYNDWRTYDISQMGIGSWPASYRQRLAVECLMQNGRDKPAADIGGDCIVNCGDLGEMSTQWLQAGKPWLSADLNGDGQVNLSDLVLLRTGWLEGL